MKSKIGLVVGGSGALGKSVVSVFKNNGWRLLNVDLTANTEADFNLILDSQKKMQEQISQVHKETSNFSKSFDSIICTAGGFEMGSVRDHDIFQKYDRLDKMCT